MTRQPGDYKHILAWGFLMCSHSHFIRDQQEFAAREGAPLDAIYFDEDTGQWHTFSDVKDEGTRERMVSLVSPK